MKCFPERLDPDLVLFSLKLRGRIRYLLRVASGLRPDSIRYRLLVHSGPIRIDHMGIWCYCHGAAIQLAQQYGIPIYIFVSLPSTLLYIVLIIILCPASGSQASQYRPHSLQHILLVQDILARALTSPTDDLTSRREDKEKKTVKRTPDVPSRETGKSSLEGRSIETAELYKMLVEKRNRDLMGF